MNATRPLKVGVVGGSISWGTGATMRGERDWFSLFMSWLASVSSYPVTGRNGCIPGTPSHYMVLCLEHSVDVDLDLVLVEYVFNDGLDDCDCIRNNGVVKSVEQLLRKLMDLPSRPAVVMVQVPHVRSKDFDPFFRTSEDLEGALAAYYDIPTVSLRDALYPLNVHRPTEGFLWNQTYNEHHPGDAGHKALADIVVHLIQETALGLLSYPPSREEAAKLERPLLPPMYTGNLPPSTSVCLVGHTFTSLVTYAQGWSWVNEGTEEKPKWGYVATEPGSRLVVRLPDTLPPGGRHAAAAAVPVLLHYLQSYAGMGKARVECGGGGCNCSTVVVDALHLGRSSQTYMALVMVEGLGLMAGEGEAGTKREGDDGAAAPAGCELSVTVLEETSSILDGGHKFKAEEDAALIWPFLDRMSSLSPDATGTDLDDAACWRSITETAAELVSPSVGKLIPLTLGSRQYGAKLQMVRQLAEQFHPHEVSTATASCCFVALEGQVATTPQQLADLLTSSSSSPSSSLSTSSSSTNPDSEQLFSFEHIYRGKATGSLGGAETSRVAILYGSPGLPCFGPLYEQLKTAVDEQSVGDGSGGGNGLMFAFRPLLTTTCEPLSGCARAGTGGQLLLPGWGVEAALKNTEYSAMDDKEVARQRQQQQQQGGTEGSGDDEEGAAEEADFGSGDDAVVKGFRLDVLAARRPDLRSELLTFRDQLLAADDEESAELKVWDLRDVGLQATQRILGSSDPLALLAEISQNFPGIVSSLSRQVVSSSLKNAVTHNQQMVSAGANFLLLNGLAVDVNNLDFFGFLSRLRSEMRLRDSLVGAPLELSPNLAKQVLAARAEDGAAAGAGGGGAGGEGEPRLSLGSTSSAMSKHVAFLNDLERDPRFQRFGRNLAELLNTFPGRLRPLARNVFTSVVVVEPLCSESLELVANIDRMWQGGYPIRFGGERFGRGFATLKEAFGPAAAWRMWIDAAEAVTSGYYSDPQEVVEAAFTSAWGAAARSPPPGTRAKTAARKSTSDALKMLKEGSGYAAEVGMQLMETASWLMIKGLVAPPPAAAVAAAATPAADRDEDAERCTAPPVVWMNGLTAKAGGSSPAEDIMYKVMGEMQRLQEAIYFGRMDDNSGGGDALAAVLEMFGAVERLNQRIVGPKARNAQVLNLVPLLRHPAHETLRMLYRESGSEDGDGTPYVAPVTHYVAADLANEEGRQLVAESLRLLSEVLPSSSSRDCRLVLVANPSQPAAAPSLLEALVEGGMRQLESGGRDKPLAPLHSTHPGSHFPISTSSNMHGLDVVSYLSRLMSDSALAAGSGGEAAGGGGEVEEQTQEAIKYAEEAGLDGEAIKSFLAKAVDESLTYRAVQADLCRTVFKLEPGAAAVISNGRVTPVYKPSEEHSLPNIFVPTKPSFQIHLELLAEDLSLLQRVTSGGMAGSVAKAVERAYSEGLQRLPADLPSGVSASDALSEISSTVVSALSAASRAAASAGSQEGSGGASRLGPGASLQLQQMMAMLKRKAVEVSGGPDPPFHLEAVLNPLSRSAQRLTSLLLVLREALGPSMSLTLNPQKDITEMPLKSYYRRVQEAGLGGQGGKLRGAARVYALPSGLAPGSGPPGPPTAYFSRLPARRVLTLNLDAPEAWLVEPAAALYDLDNLRLEDVAGEVAFAEFELDALMLTGSCVDVTASGRMTPPRGLQLHLGTPTQPHTVDTLVMANLAYFQLKAAPGRWLLSLAPGRSRDLYLLQSSTGTSRDVFAEEEEGSGEAERVAGALVRTGGGGGGDDVSTQVLISSFMGKHMILRVRKRPGMEAEDVLQADGTADDAYDTWDPDLEDDEYADDDDDKAPPAPSSGGLLGKVSSLLSGSAKGGSGGAGGELAASKKQRQLRGGDTINVFTVASGHMYERLQKIMILSVLRHTKSRVKFWIIKNYMSPQHKQVIPAMAEQFGFDYEFVTYKWPHWLHKQTDKQRLIWAYKILFLDVLFPLGVDRIIFVDSDQVVHADLAELYHKDIKGAPYAYTPFCDNNKEMDEYRFWKGGFWRDHLQGKPYHISALYLVDLKRFRQIAAGDQLRVLYDQLSKDPNSLANLDQDLPNYAQHSIRIFSLPQVWCGVVWVGDFGAGFRNRDVMGMCEEWLWCESWCGNVTKAKAKTIDLCNNPKTKEPKLTAARRIIGPLWEELDRQQEEVTRMVQSMLEAREEAGPPGSALPPPQPPAVGEPAGHGQEEEGLDMSWEAADQRHESHHASDRTEL
ncbi:hypothetical protein VOLCADRAFT_105823 [Volvox carteri f. nagariensis]|uniref:UDP-glucose:glycoprotein glucosyltransferase n=1 Tax=Volvox carteri f. nagariensis TaxID=3068 RepID=D8U3D9_VOLCA|nr:uncharacterized protein VOLCADRAFT_105823 [Volvox carteri f. nagariensis]EFJ45735.1 hypothetical protein VOLCADRAFT_105823 [Volvox carteri f. nagariensis]|eukprot:XP_002953136.1 hypothetical protein VOLCADRAFT_105823 [Volvox carteri f. nagariensis]